MKERFRVLDGEPDVNAWIIWDGEKGRAVRHLSWTEDPNVVWGTKLDTKAAADVLARHLNDPDGAWSRGPLSDLGAESLAGARRAMNRRVRRAPDAAPELPTEVFFALVSTLPMEDRQGWLRRWAVAQLHEAGLRGGR